MTDAPHKRQVFAVVRIDHYLQSTVESPAELIAIKEIMLTKEEADREADRLNRLMSDQGDSAKIEYVVHHLRLVLHDAEGEIASDSS